MSIKTRQIIYEQINDRFSKIKQLDIALILDTNKGDFINATKACKYNKKKTFRDWKRLKAAKSLVFDLQEDLGLSSVMYELEITKKYIIRKEISVIMNNGRYSYEEKKIKEQGNVNLVNGDTSGTYVHEELIPIIMTWHSNKYAIKMSRIIKKINNKRELRRLDEKWEREMAKQAKLHKKTADNYERTVRKKNRSIKKKKCVIEKLREEMKKYQEQTMKGINFLKVQNDETKEKLDEAKEERDEVLTNLSDLNNKVDNIVDTIVPPCQRTSKTENCIIFKIPRNENSKKVLDCYQRKDNKLPEFMDYYVTCCQIRANESVKNKLRRKHGVNPTILKQLTPSPNSKNIYHRFQDKYGAKVSKTKNTKKKIVYNRNYIGLYDTTTEADMLRFLDEVEAEKEFRDEIVV